MNTRQDLMRILGLSYKQLRVRLAALDREGNLLDKQVVKRANGRLEYSPAVLEMLRDLAPIAQEPGKDNRQAARELSQSIQGNGDASRQGHTVNQVNLGTMESLQALLAEKDKRLQDKDVEVKYLRDRLTFLEGQLALAPVPRRRSWFGWLKGIRVQRQSI
jgi:hypothetical protein